MDSLDFQSTAFWNTRRCSHGKVDTLRLSCGKGHETDEYYMGTKERGRNGGSQKLHCSSLFQNFMQKKTNYNQEGQQKHTQLRTVCAKSSVDEGNKHFLLHGSSRWNQYGKFIRFIGHWQETAIIKLTLIAWPTSDQLWQRHGVASLEQSSKDKNYDGQYRPTTSIKSTKQKTSHQKSCACKEFIARGSKRVERFRQTRHYCAIPTSYYTRKKHLGGP